MVVKESDISVFATVESVFPRTTADEPSLRSILAKLSRDDTLFTCARLNAVVSGFGPNRSIETRQTQALDLLGVSPGHRYDLAEFAKRHGGAARVSVFFRGQLLELARWVVKYCQNLPGDGETYRDPETRMLFLKAALITSRLWEQRIGPGSLRLHEPLEKFLGFFRKSVEEGNQAPPPGLAMSRGWVLFTRYLSPHLPQFTTAFEQATGLSLRQYYIVAFSLLNRTFFDHPEHDRIIKSDSRIDATAVGEMIGRFLRLNSQTPDAWAQRLAADPCDSGYLAIRERPIFEFSGDRAIIFDPSIYVDNLTSAPLFQVRSAGVSLQQAFNGFGHAFEDYAIDLLRHRFPQGTGLLHQRLRSRLLGVNAQGQKFEVDAMLNEIVSAVVFEMKANWIREDTVLHPNPEVFLTELRRKYGYLPDESDRGKGVAQLARSVGALVRREWLGQDGEYRAIKALYPVLLVFDQRMGAPGLGHFLNVEFRRLLGTVPQDVFVHPLIILTIGDLEHLVSAVESLSLEAFLRAYSAADPDRLSSVHNFIAHSDYLNAVRESSVLSEVMENFMSAARAELRPSEQSAA